MLKVLLGPSSFGEFDPAPLKRLKESGCEVILNPHRRKLSKNELFELLGPDVVGLIAGLETLDQEVLEKTNLRVISRCGSGMSNVDLEAAKRLKIAVCSTPHAPVGAVAELVVGAMLSLLREIPRMNQDLHDGRWVKRLGTQLEAKTVLTIGFGRIGQKVASLLKPFEVNLIAVDPHKQEKFDGVSFFSLSQALTVADVITIHCSAQEQVLGAKEFSLMKDGVFLLNASRGEVVEEAALLKALENKKVAGAWIDTFWNEPYDGALKKYPQVILTPHTGSYTRECRRAMEMEAAENLLAALSKSNHHAST